MNKLLKAFRNDYVFSIFIKVMMLAVGIFHSAFLARFLGPELKGIAATVTSSVALSQIVFTFGIQQAYPYYKRQGKIDRFLEIFVNNTYFIYAVLFAIAAGAIFLFRDVLSQKIIYTLLLTPIFSYETVISYVYLIEKPLKRNTWFLLATLIETLVCFVFWLLFEPNYTLMMVAISAAVIVRCFASTIGVGVKFDLRKINLKFIAEMMQFGFFPMLSLILTVMNSKIDVLMMDMHEQISAAAIGFYSVGIGISDKILAIPDAIREILLSKLAAGKSEDEVARVSRISFLLCLLMAVCVTVFGKPIIYILFGSEYMGAYGVLVISSFGAVFMVFLKMISQYNIVLKRQLANLLMLAVSVITCVVLNLLLIPRLGIEGAALASFTGHLVCAICFVGDFHKQTGIKCSKLILPQKEDFALIAPLVQSIKTRKTK